MAPRGANSVIWLRRDLRLHDHPAFVRATLAVAGPGSGAVALFVIDDALWGPSGDARRAYLVRSLRHLDNALDGRLVVRRGDPVQVVPALAHEVNAAEVHITADTGPYGRRRDDAVAAALREDGHTLVATGTPYAVGPGRLVTGAGTPFKVFTPFRRAWARHGWRLPAEPVDVDRVLGGIPGCDLPDEPDLGAVRLPEAGEAAAQARWQSFTGGPLADYADHRDRPATAGTSELSVSLKFGELHPRTLLADLARLPSSGADLYRNQLCWRDFYGDVLWHQPESARAYLRPEYATMRYDEPAEQFEAWQRGRTGFPFVDAGMRQLLGEGWMHNRVRMVVASFLIKDLHIEWQHGARHFMKHLRDGDLALNQHGWQWVAGSGTDAAPYFRVFNPITQGLKFDPDGAYVRRYVPELAHLPGAAAHRPWDHQQGLAHGYPGRIVDHATERLETLARYQQTRSS
jgi:deoxyribodipyrimidine photo-lyase